MARRDSKKTYRLLLVTLIVSICIVGCDKRHSVEFTDFSSGILTIHHEGEETGIVGLNVKTKGALSGVLRMNLGSGGKVFQTLLIPQSGRYSARLDWYDTTLEVSFVETNRITGKLIASFQFITL